jgi:alkanesulfonate monooxygenase SsuD/methylene tetrahydromethanopterin reductase-like flavin-dependent oxidoreductase (luciferase family)
VAEEFAMLDNITGGRFIAGFVRGIGAEYHSWAINPALSHERFHEAHDLIVRAWTEPGPFAFEGKHYQLNYVNLWPRPYQQPHPPIWIPSQGSRETIEWASHPSRKYTYLHTFSPVSAVKIFADMYRESAARYGYQATPDQIGWAMPLYCAETDEIAKREAKPHIEFFFNKLLRMPFEMLMPPGYTSLASVQAQMKARKGVAMSSAGPTTIDGVMEKAIVLCGSPATLREQLEAYQDDIGFEHALPMMQFGSLPHDLVTKSTALFAKEVIPYFRKKATSKPQRVAATV